MLGSYPIIRARIKWFAAHFYDEAGHVLEECPAGIGEGCNPGGFQQFIWLADIPVAAILTTMSFDEEGFISQVPELFNVHSDHLNTARRLTRSNSSNQLVWRWNSDPFGIGVAEGNLAGGLSPYTFDLRFAGQVFDAETGLHYNYFRDYDPQVGRYVESDPIGLDGGANTYSYANLNPVSNSDPSGLFILGPQTIQDIGDMASAAGAVLAGRPQRVPGRVACHARCPTIPTKCPEPYCPVVYGYGVGVTVTDAKNASRAHANAQSPPGCQLKHCTYKCTGPKGEPIYPSR